MRRWARRLVLIPALFALASCSGKQNVFSPKGSVAQKINDLQVPVFIAAGVVGVIVAIMLAYVMITGARRAKSTDVDEPVQIHGNTRLELMWTMIPFLILVAVAFPTVFTILNISHRSADTLKVDVYGQQWWWSYEYDVNNDGTPDIITANDLVLPEHRKVELRIHSRDVIHSFWIPALAGTRDAVPGRTQYLEIETDNTGEFDGQCKEFCGLSHANMRIRVFVQTPADYQAWVTQQQQPQTAAVSGDAAAGKKLFLHGGSGGSFPGGPACSGCHSVAGTSAQGVVGPDLTHFASRTRFAGETYVNDTQNLMSWLDDPPRMKPGVDMPKLGLSSTQIKELVAYLQSLK
jgi:cytochrome c oxidase subunit II